MQVLPLLPWQQPLLPAVLATVSPAAAWMPSLMSWQHGGLSRWSRQHRRRLMLLLHTSSCSACCTRSIGSTTSGEHHSQLMWRAHRVGDGLVELLNPIHVVPLPGACDIGNHQITVNVYTWTCCCHSLLLNYHNTVVLWQLAMRVCWRRA